MPHGSKTIKLRQETALGLCVAKGVTETTLRDLATAAGLARGGKFPHQGPLPRSAWWQEPALKGRRDWCGAS
jgi:hypothetical protein